MNDVASWQRVRFKRWIPGRSVYFVDVKLLGKRITKQRLPQVAENVIAVTVPVEDPDYPGKVVAFPLEFMSGGRQWVKIDPRTRYNVLRARDLTLLGPAYAEEIARIKEALPLFGFDVVVPDKSRKEKRELTPREVRRIERLHRRNRE